MNWTLFLSGLFEQGRLTMPPLEKLSRADLAALAEQLTPYERTRRLQAPAGTPAWDPDAGCWAAAMLYRACQFAVHRDLDERAMRHQLDDAGPEPSPSAHYSVDLCFRYLPDLLKLSAAASPEDPLNQRLRQWCAAWPLSSVGVADLPSDTLRLAGLRECPALLQIYADRVLAVGDAERLRDGAVRQAVQQAVGAHESLAGPLAAALREPQQTTLSAHE